jgi:probable rRNA maturation factor
VEIDVEISDTQGHLRVNRADLVHLAQRVLVREGRRRASISIALVDQATIHLINRTHLGHDWPTDVISFPFSTPRDPVLSGELVVSVEMAVATASAIGAEPRDELALYVVHGLLHLCGHDDSTELGAGVMRQRENEMLTDCGFSNPFNPSGPRSQPVTEDDVGKRPVPPPRPLPLHRGVEALSAPLGLAGVSRPLPEQSESWPWSS